MRLPPLEASLAISTGPSSDWFWLEWWLRYLLILTFAEVYSFAMVFVGPPPRWFYVAVAFWVSLSSFWMCFRLWRLHRQVKGFGAISSRRTVVHYPPGFAGVEALPEFLQICEFERDELSQLFGVSFRRRLHVFLLPTPAPAPNDLKTTYSKEMGGRAWPGANAVFLSVSTMDRATVRHELGHLFSLRWNPSAAPIMAEGLSTWLRETDRGRTVDEAACRLFLGPRPDLKKLLDRKYFFSSAHQRGCTILAGSFTGFLIRRHGWDRYRTFYRKSWPVRFESRFQKFFGLSLKDAEQRWIVEVLTMVSLNQRLEADRLFNEFA
jgi:hypothetical protein